MIRAVDHLNIVVTDLSRSVRFYTDLLGFRLVKEARLGASGSTGLWV